MSSNLKVNSLVPATGTEIGIGTTGGTIDFRCPATFGGNVTIGGTLTYDEVINIDSIGIVTARAGLHAKDDSTFYGVTSGRNVVWDKSENSLEFGDYTYAKFGLDEDLTVWSNNTASAINNKTGELRILSGTNVRILKRNDAGLGFAGQVANFNIDGSCDLWDSGTKRIETTSTGAVVTGILTATGDLSIADKIVHTGDTNTAIRFPSADTITAETGGTERFKIQSDGLKEIKNGRLRITSTFIDFAGNISTPSTGSAIFRPATDTLAVSTNNVERLRIDSAGKLLVGHTGRIAGDVTAQLQVEGTSYHTSSLALIANSGASAGNNSHITLAKSRGSSDGSNTILVDDDSIGIIQWAASDGTDLNCVAANIRARVDGTPGSNDMPGSLEFGTTSDGATAPTERLRIDSAGRIKIGTTSAAATNEAVTIKGDSNGDCFLSLRSSAHADGNDQRIRFMVGDAIGSSGNICSSLSSEINQTSSGTLKANLVISANRGDALTNRYIIYGDNSVDHEFKTKTAATLLKLHNSGLVEIADGDLKVANGHGIDFSATSGTGTSEKLNDYEEGTWNPIFTDDGSSGNSASSYGSQLGWYTKIGNLVNVQMRISNAVFSSFNTSHATYVKGLPYVVQQSSNRLTTGTALLSNCNLDSDTMTVGVICNSSTGSGNSWFRLFQAKDNTAWVSIKISQWTSGDNEILVNFSYRTDAV